MNLLNNIRDNYIHLHVDWLNFTLHIGGIGQFFLHLFIAACTISIFYLLGEKFRGLFFKENKKFNFFVSIALGYIAIGTGIGILGAFSVLYTQVISAYLLVIVIIALYPISRFTFKKATYNSLIAKIKTNIDLHKNFVGWAVLLFVFISFLRLMTPEITEDGYHTDLPHLYLATHTSIHETKEMLHVIPYPQLPEMVYLVPIFLGQKEAVRFIHFGFYLLIIFLLFAIAKDKRSSFAAYAPLLFVTAPVVIRYAPSQYTDFFMLFAFLLSILLLEKNSSRNTVILSGIIYGAALSAKVWTLIYMPAFLLYLVLLKRKLNSANIFKFLMIFVTSSLSVALLWYGRAYVIAGNPVYPIFSKLEYPGESNAVQQSPLFFLGINWNMFSYDNMIVLSPLFFLGALFTLFNLRNVINKVKGWSLSLFFVVMALEQLVIKVDLGRYLFAWYTVSSIIISAGVMIVIEKMKAVRFIFIALYFLIFSYYFINTLLVLPYGFGWADKNAYLTRVLGRDNANYYDFDRLFDKWISDKDFVATYGIVSFYYADFKYIDIGYIFSEDNRSFDLLKKRGATKLLIKGGDIEWFCERLSLSHCEKNKVKLLATWPDATKKYNLYSIQK